MKTALRIFHYPVMRQRGVVLLYTLIALVVLLIGGVALTRSFNTSLFTAGNIAFKRDLQNQGERAVDRALTAFRAGGALDSPTDRAANIVVSNYSATMLAVNPQGIPLALADDTSFAAVGVAANDITVAGQGVTIRYVIDRMCNAVGDENTLGADHCVIADNLMPAGGSATNLQSAERAPLCSTCSSATPKGVVYRLSVKVTGPRRTQAYFQSTLTIPSST